MAIKRSSQFGGRLARVEINSLAVHWPPASAFARRDGELARWQEAELARRQDGKPEGKLAEWE